MIFTFLKTIIIIILLARWVPCPASLTGGGNMSLYFKPGSHKWDTRVQVMLQKRFSYTTMASTSMKVMGLMMITMTTRQSKLCKTLRGPLDGGHFMLHDTHMMRWWCADDTLMMRWWCPDDALMMHWWCTDEALMMHWRCTDDTQMIHG